MFFVKRWQLQYDVWTFSWKVVFQKLNKNSWLELKNLWCWNNELK